MNQTIRVKKLRPSAMLPTYGTLEAAGADLRACGGAGSADPGIYIG